MKSILSPSVGLPDQKKLHILRRLDQLRQWHSLDDKRYCLVCDKIITGHQIQVTSDTNTRALRLRCPSEGCNSIPMDWMLPTDEILARMEMLTAKGKAAATSICVDGGRTPKRGCETRDRIASQLWTFVSYFNRRA